MYPFNQTNPPNFASLAWQLFRGALDISVRTTPNAPRSLWNASERSGYNHVSKQRYPTYFKDPLFTGA